MAPSGFFSLTIIAIGNGLVFGPISSVAEVRSIVPLTCFLNVGGGLRSCEVVASSLDPTHSGFCQSNHFNAKSGSLISFDMFNQMGLVPESPEAGLLTLNLKSHPALTLRRRIASTKIWLRAFLNFVNIFL